MSVIGCILLAVVARDWKSTIIYALIMGLLGSAVFGLLRFEEAQYGITPKINLAFYIAVGTAAFVAETAAFFAAKLGIIALWARIRTNEEKQP